MTPICELCGDRHEKHRAHRFAPVANDVANVVANKVANKSKKTGRYKDPEARKKYMRELMRKRRAR